MAAKPTASDAANKSLTTSHLLLRALQKHWMLGMTLVALVVLADTLYTIGQPRIFRATMSIQIDPSPPRPLGNDVQAVVDMGSGNYWNIKEYFNTQQKILEGRSIARETARLLDLAKDASFMQYRLRPKRTTHQPDLEDATNSLMSRVTVEPVRESRLLNIASLLRDQRPCGSGR